LLLIVKCPECGLFGAFQLSGSPGAAHPEMANVIRVVHPGSKSLPEGWSRMPNKVLVSLEFGFCCLATARHWYVARVTVKYPDYGLTWYTTYL
jgi:hypothetical protein